MSFFVSLSFYPITLFFLYCFFFYYFCTRLFFPSILFFFFCYFLPMLCFSFTLILLLNICLVFLSFLSFFFLQFPYLTLVPAFLPASLFWLYLAVYLSSPNQSLVTSVSSLLPYSSLWIYLSKSTSVSVYRSLSLYTYILRSIFLNLSIEIFFRIFLKSLIIPISKSISLPIYRNLSHYTYLSKLSQYIHRSKSVIIILLELCLSKSIPVYLSIEIRLSISIDWNLPQYIYQNLS